jgi:peptidoglycan/xylan/chitin deacetylase (PgdA/CDA1 family)
MRKTFSDLARRLSPRHSAGDAVVLMYHRVCAGAFPGGVSVSPAHFAEHLQALRGSFTILPLGELCRLRAAGTVPRRSLAITFDDGYLDNLTEAKPLLEQYDVPATVFVVSGYVGSGQRFWWDELERICTSPETLPGHLELSIRGVTRTWTTASNHDRRPFFRELREELGALEESERQETLGQLRSWAGATTRTTEVETLSTDQLKVLSAGEIVSIGAHTVTHPRLPGLSRQRQLEEIRDSTQQLESMIGRSVSLFSYPFGAHDQTTVACAREAGVACACTTDAGGVRGSTDPHRLPRLYVGDWPAEDVVARISARLH